MRSFEHIDVHTIDEACTALRRYRGGARLNAGGTDLLQILKGDILPDYPEAIINIKTIPGLDYIRKDRNVLRIGALARLSTLSRSPLLNEKYKVLAEAAHAVASPQIRNMATLGGNLCQDVRCWYYRYPRVIGGPIQCARKGSGPCLAVKGDNRYHAMMHGRKCFAVCPSDAAVALTALDARIVIVKAKARGGTAHSDSKRIMPTEDFFKPLGNALGVDEMVREVEIPIRKTAGQQVFLKFTLRKPIDFAIVSVASVLTFEREICTDARIVLGAVGPAPVRAKEAEAVLIGYRLSEEIALAAGEAALTGAKPLSKNAYKVEIAKALVKRAILGDTKALA